MEGGLGEFSSEDFTCSTRGQAGDLPRRNRWLRNTPKQSSASPTHKSGGTSPFRLLRLSGERADKVLYKQYIKPFIFPGSKQEVFKPSDYSGVIYDQEASGLGIMADRVLTVTRTGKGSEDSLNSTCVTRRTGNHVFSLTRKSQQSQPKSLAVSIDKPFRKLVDRIQELTHIKKDKFEQQQDAIKHKVLKSYKGWTRGWISPEQRGNSSRNNILSQSLDIKNQNLTLGWRNREQIVDGFGVTRRNPMLETLNFGRAISLKSPTGSKTANTVKKHQGVSDSRRYRLSSSPRSKLMHQLTIR